MEASDLRRVRELEAENAKLKRMYADLALENTAMRDAMAKKAMTPAVNARWRVIWSNSTAWRSVGPVSALVYIDRLTTGIPALDGEGCGDHSRVGIAGRRSAESRLLEVPQVASSPRAELEPQTDLSGVQGHGAEPASSRQAAVVEAGSHTPLCAADARYGLVSRLHGRCTGQRQTLPDV